MDWAPRQSRRDRDRPIMGQPFLQRDARTSSKPDSMAPCNSRRVCGHFQILRPRASFGDRHQHGSRRLTGEERITYVITPERIRHQKQ